MKLYKIDFTNTIGDYMVTVPTDSQFLLGISNGDSEADVELLDGETEITPEDEKIGAYTVFNFETDGTPFRKHLKANINGQKPVTKYWDAHEYNLVNGEDTSTIAILDGDVFAELKTEPNIHAEFDGDDTMTVKFKDASGNYSTTLTYTYNNALVAGGIACTVWDAPEEIDEEISSTYLIPKKIRIKNVKTIWGWNKIEPNYTGQSSTVNWKATPLVADIQIPYEGYDPYTDKLNIVVKCDKMSVAYRDFEGNGGGTFSPCMMDTTTSVVQVTPDNLATVERTIYTASVDAEDFSISKSVTFNIDEDAFTAAGVNCNNAVWEFKVLFEIPVVEEGVLPGDWSETTAPNLVSFRTKNGENLGNLGGVSLVFGDGEMELVTQYLVVPDEGTKRVGITIRLFRSFDAFDDNLCARLFYLAHDI